MDEKVSLQRLREAIPTKCFRPSAVRSALHVVADVVCAGALAALALQYIPQYEFWPLRYLLWAVYGYIQGLVFTGIWILAHECGHQALFSGNVINDVVGFFLHTALLVPYFSWKYTHARHHRYTNHIEKDTAFAPSQASEGTWTIKVAERLHHAEDAPLYSAVLLAAHQLLGWQAYVLGYASGGVKSTPRTPNGQALDRTLLNPGACMFFGSERVYVGLSTLGLLATMGILYVVGGSIGYGRLALLYFVPYLWVNNWLVAITYLHHTHPDVPHFGDAKWTYVDGALSTIDRPFGFVGRHVFHGIIDFHVVHHLFP